MDIFATLLGFLQPFIDFITSLIGGLGQGGLGDLFGGFFGS